MDRRKVYAWVLAGLLIVSALLAASGMSAIETSLFHTIYDMPSQLRQFAILVTQLGSGWVLVLIVALLLVRRRNPKLALLVLRNGVLAYGGAEVLKHVVNRPRPFILLSGVVSRDVIAAGAGYPSGHTAMATALGLTLWPYLPKQWRWIVPVWIGLVAWSRLYLGVHAPLDIVGGFALGALIVLVPNYWGLQKHKRGRKLKTEV